VHPLRAGIVTSLLVSLLGQARIYVVLGREQLLPSWFARIHPTRDTPMRAAIFTGCTAGAPPACCSTAVSRAHPHVQQLWCSACGCRRQL
jgi:amino acid transporter